MALRSGKQTCCFTLPLSLRADLHTCSHIEQHGGMFFSCSLYGLRRWKHIIKVPSRSGIYWKEFLPSVNPCLKGLLLTKTVFSPQSCFSPLLRFNSLYPTCHCVSNLFFSHWAVVLMTQWTSFINCNSIEKKSKCS